MAELFARRTQAFVNVLTRQAEFSVELYSIDGDPKGDRAGFLGRIQVYPGK